MQQTTTSDPHPAPPKPPQKRWLKIILFASLTLNLMVAGLFIGSQFGAPPPHERSKGKSHKAERHIKELGVGPLGQALQDPHRKAFTERTRSKADRAQLRKDLRKLGNDMTVILRAETFDRDAAIAVLQQQNRLLQQRVTSNQNALLDVIEATPLQDRIIMADRLDARLKRGKAKKRP